MTTERPAKILIVDDQEDIRLITRMSLRRLKWHNHPVDLHFACSGGESIAFIENHSDTQVVIMDIMMEHDRAGLDAIEAIHKMHPQIQLIVQTAQAALMSEQQVIRDYPITNYVTKSTEGSERLGNIVLLALKNYDRLREASRHFSS
jgi:c-di-GMP phosphodiesterase